MRIYTLPYHSAFVASVVAVAVLMFTCLSVIASAICHNDTLTGVSIRIKDGKDLFLGIGIPVYTYPKDDLIGVTDSLGFCHVDVKGVSTDIRIKSLFYNEAYVTVYRDQVSEICLSPVDVVLGEILVKTFRLNSLIRKSTSQFRQKYLCDPQFMKVHGKYTIRNKDKYLEYYEMDGVGFTSGNLKWKSWDYSPLGGVGSSFFYTSPLEERRSLRWTSTGDTISSYDTHELPFSHVFLFRPVFRALEISGPQFRENIKYYDFRIDREIELDTCFVVDFKTKDKYLKKQDQIFLYGQGKLWIDRDDLFIEKLEFYFSGYNDVNLEPGRPERSKKIFGKLALSFQRRTDGYYPGFLEFECHWNDDRWYRPRNQMAENKLVLHEEYAIERLRPMTQEEREYEKLIEYVFYMLQ